MAIDNIFCCFRFLVDKFESKIKRPTIGLNVLIIYLILAVPSRVVEISEGRKFNDCYDLMHH